MKCFSVELSAQEFQNLGKVGFYSVNLFHGFRGYLIVEDDVGNRIDEKD